MIKAGNIRTELNILVSGRMEHATVALMRKNGECFLHGNPMTQVILHSIAKPFQLLPLMKRYGDLIYKLNSCEIAIMASSHNGEIIHRDIIRDLLTRAGIHPQSLLCGYHEPYFEWQREEWDSFSLSEKTIANNCSGKHVGMLLACKLEGWRLDDYVSMDHPLQLEILNNIKTLSPGAEYLREKDGCGVPTYRTDIVSVLKLYLSLMHNEDHLSKLRNAMVYSPYILAGKCRIETLLMNMLSNSIVKSGVGGILAIAMMESDECIVIYSNSGSEIVSEYVAIMILQQLRYLDEVKTGKIIELYDYKQLQMVGKLDV